jgi:DNA uptake protein ComE-like DNA-binding protein
MSTSAIAQEKDLQSGVGALIAQVSQQLFWDLPWVDPNQEYYDYPDANNAWLANLEPDKSDNGTPLDPNDDFYFWRQISDVFNQFGSVGVQADIAVDYQLPAQVQWGLRADADGDGVYDSAWTVIPDVNSSKGEPVFAAVRVVDDGGMLNVNTGYKFDPNSIVQTEIDGSSQLQINLMALSWRPGYDSYNINDEKTLIEGRGSVYPFVANPRRLYESGVIWQYGNSFSGYTPFDISDELELRNRFLLNNTDIDTRLESWGGEFRKQGVSSTPFKDLAEWYKSAYEDFLGGVIDKDYAYRHLATTYNMDRVIHPYSAAITSGPKMININSADVNSLYEGIYAGLQNAGVSDVDRASQIAVNLIDYRDGDSVVTKYLNAASGKTYYGAESPCVYISELAYVPVIAGPNTYQHYAIELYKPYFEDADPVGWQLVIDGNSIPVNWSTGSRRFYVMFFADMKDPNVGAIKNSIVFFDANAPKYDPSDPNTDPSNYKGRVDANALYSYHFVGGSEILLRRPDNGEIIVDRFVLPVDTPWPSPIFGESSFQRDISPHKCIRRLWSNIASLGHTLGGRNFFTAGGDIIQAHPKNERLTNIGEIGMVFQRSAYQEGADPTLWIGPTDTQGSVLVNLANPVYQYLFNYLTVMDPASYIADVNETRIKGRININTAPWFVLAQLPWVSESLAETIVDLREAMGGYKTIGQLEKVVGMDSYARDSNDLRRFPEITPVKEFEPGDGAVDDFKERDIIFTRISNLVTVRSDVFTAYILVRLGQTGPQKRMIAIFDRSDVRPDPANAGKILGKVKIRALYEVPDAR